MLRREKTAETEATTHHATTATSVFLYKVNTRLNARSIGIWGVYGRLCYLHTGVVLPSVTSCLGDASIAAASTAIRLEHLTASQSSAVITSVAMLCASIEMNTLKFLEEP